MHITEIILDGFKSYPNRTVISGWDPEFNAVTGLNGSGKSNILDAICFVLGISNLSQVRCPRLRDPPPPATPAPRPLKLTPTASCSFPSRALPYPALPCPALRLTSPCPTLPYAPSRPILRPILRPCPILGARQQPAGPGVQARPGRHHQGVGHDRV